MAAKRSDRLAAGYIPQPCRVVLAAGQDAFAIRREGHTIDLATMAAEGADRPAIVYIPQASSIVCAAGEDSLAVKCKGHAEHLCFMPTERLNRLRNVLVGK